MSNQPALSVLERVAIGAELSVLGRQVLRRFVAIGVLCMLFAVACSPETESVAPTGNAEPPTPTVRSASEESATSVASPTATSTTVAKPTATPVAVTPTRAAEPPTATALPSPTSLPDQPIGTPVPADPTPTATSPIQPTSTPAPTATSSPIPIEPTATPAPTSTPLPTGPIPQISTEFPFPNLHFTTFGDNTVFLTYPPDGSDRIVVVEKEGKVSIFDNTPTVSNTSTFLDIRSRVSTAGNEEGLLGLAFHPNYAKNGHFYVYYSAAGPRRSVLSRFTVSDDPNQAVSSSEHIVLEIPQPYSNHNGGMIEFGPDGFLYVGVGDGGSSDDPHGHGQNTTTLLGSILRLDVDRTGDGKNYGIPASNPFASSGDTGGDPRPEIYAYGLRNPWRFSFDSATGELWVGDVGQDKWEEIDVVENGANYGWNTLEGFHCFSPSVGCDSSGTTYPVAEYDHSGRCSVTGGFVYRGAAIPSLHGVYIFGDFCSGEIWGIRTNDRTALPELIASGYKWSPSFGKDAHGNIYLLTLGGAIQRITLR